MSVDRFLYSENREEESRKFHIEEVVYANPSDACGGVVATELFFFKLAADYVCGRENIYTFNLPVHNRRLAELSKDLGLVVTPVDEDGNPDFSSFPPNSLALISAHGCRPSDIASLESRGCTVLDTTCVVVHGEHKKAGGLDETGLLIGRRVHPETRGTMGFAGEGSLILVEDILDLEEHAGRFEQNKEIPVLFQTTTSGRDNSRILARARELFGQDRVRVLEDRCYATDHRQLAVEKLIGQVDGFVIIGSGDISNNTRNMAKIPQEESIPVMFADNVYDIDPGWFVNHGIKKLGMAAGASVMPFMAQEFIDFFRANGISVRLQEPVAHERKVSFPIKATRKLQLLEERYKDWPAPGWFDADAIFNRHGTSSSAAQMMDVR